MRSFRLIDKRTGEITFEGQEARRGLECPVCASLHKNPSWCLIDRYRGLVICPRVKSKREIGEAGWLHSTGSDCDEFYRAALKSKRAVREEIDYEGWRIRQQDCVANIRASDAQRLATIWGLPSTSIEALLVGTEGRCWTVPIFDGCGRVVGIRTIDQQTRKKLSVKGSRGGIFIIGKKPTRGDLVVVTEGESDTAAAHAIGFDRVCGRTGSLHARAECRQWCGEGSHVVIVRDRDSDGAVDPGYEGAHLLAESLRAGGGQAPASVVVVAPPVGVKDLREWVVRRGCSREAVLLKADAVRGRRVQLPAPVVAVADRG